MPILVGIDEAGLGPVLGPMVTSAVVLDVPPHLVSADLWTTLTDGLAPKPLVSEPRIVVADSKRLSAREDGLLWLERGTLGLLGCMYPWEPGSVTPDVEPIEPASNLPPTCLALLERLCPEALPVLKDCPWYGAPASLPLTAERGGLQLRVQKLQRSLTAAGVRPVGVWCGVLFEPAFNEWIERTRNKAVVCWQQTARLIQRAIHVGAEDIYVDRQGGRQFYLDQLLPMADAGRWQVLEEETERSVYRCEFPAAERPPVKITFSTGAEKHSLPVAWASLVSKYVRETFMHRMNRFFAEYLPTLRPTAGYLPDGLRFLEDVAPVLHQLQIAPERMRRVR